MLRPDEIIELNKLILESLEGVISKERFAELDRRIAEDADAARAYAEFISINSELCKPGTVGTSLISAENSDQLIMSNSFWQALAENEKTASVVEVERPENDEPKIDNMFTQKRKVVKRRRRVSQMTLFTAIFSTAALFFIIAYAMFVPNKPVVVASIVDAVNAEWSVESEAAAAALELCPGPLKLLAGYANIKFKGGAEVVVQAPAEIEIETADQVFLKSGRLYSTVGSAAIGFVVRTAGATIVDYGTEFGVIARSSGFTEAHVFKGQVELRSGSELVRHGQSRRLVEGQAGEVDERGNLSVANLRAQSWRFVRSVPKDKKFGQPGKRFDLADVVGGGNGFGTGRINNSIDPVTGGLCKNPEHGGRVGSGGYVSVEELEYVDGVFVPDGGEGAVQVSSAGHSFVNCPDTSGKSWMNISDGGKFARGDLRHSLISSRVGSQRYGTSEHPAISAHANAGITFDLEAIRGSMSGVEILSFTARCLIPDAMDEEVRAEFWVLIDGQVCFNVSDSEIGTEKSFVNIPIKGGDKFLTLVATDSDGEIAGDWCLFAEAGLQLGSK